MSRSGLSVFVFAMYLLVLGLVLIVIPNVLLRFFALPETNEVWIRVVGMLVLILGFYYTHAARTDLRAFFGWTVVARTSVLLFFIAFVLADLASPVLILFGVIDFAAAMWTLLALRSEASA